jgi:hypothetical protein
VSPCLKGVLSSDCIIGQPLRIFLIPDSTLVHCCRSKIMISPVAVSHEKHPANSSNLRSLAQPQDRPLYAGLYQSIFLATQHFYRLQYAIPTPIEDGILTQRYGQLSAASLAHVRSIVPSQNTGKVGSPLELTRQCSDATWAMPTEHLIIHAYQDGHSISLTVDRSHCTTTLAPKTYETGNESSQASLSGHNYPS